jgi:hypothetical protein
MCLKCWALEGALTFKCGMVDVAVTLIVKIGSRKVARDLEANSEWWAR